MCTCCKTVKRGEKERNKGSGNKVAFTLVSKMSTPLVGKCLKKCIRSVVYFLPLSYSLFLNNVSEKIKYEYFFPEDILDSL